MMMRQHFISMDLCCAALELAECFWMLPSLLNLFWMLLSLAKLCDIINKQLFEPSAQKLANTFCCLYSIPAQFWIFNSGNAEIWLHIVLWTNNPTPHWVIRNRDQGTLCREWQLEVTSLSMTAKKLIWDWLQKDWRRMIWKSWEWDWRPVNSGD